MTGNISERVIEVFKRAQHLPEGDAARERQRCEAAKVRLSLLNAHLAAMSRDQVRAA